MASLAHILYPPPDKHGWDVWTKQHAEHHAAIEDAMAAKLGVPQQSYNLFPLYKDDLERWLIEHQSAHARFGLLLGVPTRDLGNLDLEDTKARDGWLWSQYVEHLGAASRLGTVIT